MRQGGPAQAQGASLLPNTRCGLVKLERQIDRHPLRFLLALALFGLGPVGYYLAPRPSGAPGRLGNLPEPQKNRLRQTKTGNALTSAARQRGLVSIEMRPNDQNDNGPI